ncbi:hypothetical protein VTN31DRAFT_830 [Thermomyces dupontii]|uniref:uncharacterized protein n=1 Tax=Talaromyces thermophilus TaxID=28565 RepID=UPI003743C4D0
MARTKCVRAPTVSSLPNSLRIPSNAPALVKTLGRLSRQSLLDLVLTWLSEKHRDAFPPFLARDELENAAGDQDTSPYPAAQTLDEVREAYEDLQSRKGGKREVIDRILEGDWRHGLTLAQLAMADLRYIDEHPASQRWTALRLVSVNDKKKPRRDQDDESTELSANIPRLHAATFLSNLQREIASLVKAHYYLARSKTLPVTFLRIFVTDSPYQYPRHRPEVYLDSTRILYVAFPDSSPYVYTSLSQPINPRPQSGVSDARSLQRLVRDAIPKALSRPHDRYELQPTSLAAKSLHTLLALRGPGRTNNANGAFSIFADAVVEGTPADPRLAESVAPEEYRAEDPATVDKENISPEAKTEPPGDDHARGAKRTSSGHAATDPRAAKRRQRMIARRFGTAGTPQSSVALDRLDIRLLDPPSTQGNHNEDDDNEDDDGIGIATPTLTLTFTGTDVIGGFRKLAEVGVIDPERMPPWMTGQEGVSSATVRRGQRVVSQ